MLFKNSCRDRDVSYYFNGHCKALYQESVKRFCYNISETKSKNEQLWHLADDEEKRSIPGFGFLIVAGALVA